MQNLVWKLILLDSACLPKILYLRLCFLANRKILKHGVQILLCIAVAKKGDTANNVPMLSKTNLQELPEMKL